MSTDADLVNRALQTFGTRTTVTASELANNSTNEAIQANLIFENTRQDLLRTAPWNCGMKFGNLAWITAAPGTPENQTQGTEMWEPGQPPPPWIYEYQYPVDCLRACWIVPQFQTGFAGGIPITTAVTGGAPAFWQGPPVKFKIATDEFRAVTAAAVVAGGTDYAVGDEITLPYADNTSDPIGAPVTLIVATLAGSAVATVTVKNQVLGQATPKGGSYFLAQSGTIAQDTTTGAGTGATFTLTQETAKSKQRVILTNQEFALMAYICDVTDSNVWDPLFQSAFTSILGAQLCLALTGDKGLAQGLIARGNADIVEARKADGNESLTINDVTPDFIRTRGIDYIDWAWGPNQGFDWGPLWGTWGG